MTDREILRRIDEGANFYVRQFGNAAHMETVDREYYSFVKPAGSQHSIRFAFNLKIDNLPDEQKRQAVAEIKSLEMPVWVDLLSADETFRLFFGSDKIHGQTQFTDDDEVYIAMLPCELTDQYIAAHKIVCAETQAQFAVWAKVANDVLAGGYPDMHPVDHYPLCQKGMLSCYILYLDTRPAAVAAAMNNGDAPSLEFVATLPEARRQGLARAVCAKAVSDAFDRGAKLLTVRAINAAAAKLYASIGFKPYNHAI